MNNPLYMRQWLSGLKRVIKVAFIYKITNDVNGKVYIGKTNYSVEKRFKEHCRDARRRRCEKRPLYSAMRKYGVEHFKVEQLEEVPLEMAFDRERYWIEQYKSFHNGYNATMGGDGKNYVNYDKLVDLYNDGHSINEIHEITRRDILTIRKALNNVGITHDDIERNARDKRKRPVAQIDVKTNRPLKVFKSYTDADKAIGGNRNVVKVCKGQAKTCKGYKWEYIQISDPIKDDE